MVTRYTLTRAGSRVNQLSIGGISRDTAQGSLGTLQCVLGAESLGAVGLAVGQHVCRPSRGGSQRAQFELSQDRML